MGSAKQKRKNKQHPQLSLAGLHSKKVLLRLPGKSDLAFILRTIQDQEQWLGLEREQLLGEIKHNHKNLKRQKPLLFLAVKAHSGKPIGVLRVQWGQDRRAQLQHAFLSRYHGGKLESKAHRMIVNWCLEHGAKRVWAIYSPEQD